ncbi:glutaredoxin-domain-containing protein [Ceraceosorus guamensis]|uniref:Glutaredoxin-domain-containing protein n=1 Tax=Ceraceosorus guamensis TaxID=1522189 RepID=A0A316W0U2_9BASI|nr:glutaredoxin-domain-containing protein [Ceraceosorus guamensis]PWN42728.1 glutaredoxin-domain-containing protein [Ceraceosorus guamensis]
MCDGKRENGRRMFLRRRAQSYGQSRTSYSRRRSKTSALLHQITFHVQHTDLPALASRAFTDCSRVKSALPSLGAQFKVLELDQESSGSEYQSYLAEKTGQRTVPNVFVNGKHVGGCDDFFKAQSSGELSKLIGA